MNGFNIPERKSICLSCESDDPEYRRYCVKCMIVKLDQAYPSADYIPAGSEARRSLALTMWYLRMAGWGVDDRVEKTSRIAEKLCSQWRPQLAEEIAKVRTEMYGEYDRKPAGE